MSESGGGAVREMLAIFGIGVDTSELEKGSSKLLEFTEKIKDVAAGFAAAFVGKEIMEFTAHQAELYNQISDTSDILGISTDAVQKYTYVAKSLGESAENLMGALGRLQLSAQGVGKQGKTAAKAFQELGIKVKDASGKSKSADTLFGEIAGSLEKVSDKGKKAQLLFELFGKRGTSLLPILNAGKDKISELGKEYEQFGGISKDTLALNEEYFHQTTRLGLGLGGLSAIVGKVLLPIVTRFKGALADAAMWLSKTAENSRIVEVALGALAAVGTVLAVQFAISIAPVLAIGAALAGLLLVVDDLTVFMEGGDSLIGDWIDQAFGKGQSDVTVKGIKDAWNDVVDVLKIVGRWLSDNLGTLKESLSVLATVAKYTIGLPGVVGAAIGEQIGKDIGDDDNNAGARYTGKGGAGIVRSTSGVTNGAAPSYSDFGYGPARTADYGPSEQGGGVTMTIEQRFSGDVDAKMLYKSMEEVTAIATREIQKQQKAAFAKAKAHHTKRG